MKSIVLCMVVLTGCSMEPSWPEGADAAAAAVCCQAVPQAVPTVVPSGPKKGDKCPNCNGRGTSGDGHESCIVCKGTGIYPGPGQAYRIEAKLPDSGNFGMPLVCSVEDCPHPSCGGNCGPQCLCKAPRKEVAPEASTFQKPTATKENCGPSG